MAMDQKDIDFRPALEQIVTSVNEAIADKKLCAHEYIRLVADGCQVLESILEGIGTDDEEFEQLVDDCEWAVNTHIVPYDIPFLKDFAENYIIDPNLPTIVRPALTAIRVKINAHKHEEGDEVD